MSRTQSGERAGGLRSGASGAGRACPWTRSAAAASAAGLGIESRVNLAKGFHRKNRSLLAGVVPLPQELRRRAVPWRTGSSQHRHRWDSVTLFPVSCQPFKVTIEKAPTDRGRAGPSLMRLHCTGNLSENNQNMPNFETLQTLQTTPIA
jgi:hypothetical protein